VPKCGRRQAMCLLGCLREGATGLHERVARQRPPAGRDGGRAAGRRSTRSSSMRTGCVSCCRRSRPPRRRRCRRTSRPCRPRSPPSASAGTRRGCPNPKPIPRRSTPCTAAVAARHLQVQLVTNVLQMYMCRQCPTPCPRPEACLRIAARGSYPSGAVRQWRCARAALLRVSTREPRQCSASRKGAVA